MVTKQVIEIFDQVEAILKKLLLISFAMLILTQLIFVLYPEQKAYFNKSIQYEGVAKDKPTEIVETIKAK